MTTVEFPLLFIAHPLLLRSDSPSVRPLHRLARILMRRATWCTLVECHDDVRSERTLHIHHILRGEEVLGPIEIRAEVDSFFGDLGEHASLPFPPLLQRGGFPDSLSFRRGLG